MISRNGLNGFILVTCLLCAGTSQASLISLTADAFSGPYVGFVPGSQNQGTQPPVTFDPQNNASDFMFDLNGESILSATLSGTWGHTGFGTAHNEVLMDGIVVADTRNAATNPWFSRPTAYAWSYEFTDFSALLDGVLDLRVTQTSCCYIQLGQTTLTILTAASNVLNPTAVSAPQSLFLLGLGLFLLALTVKKPSYTKAAC